MQNARARLAAIRLTLALAACSAPEPAVRAAAPRWQPLLEPGGFAG